MLVQFNTDNRITGDEALAAQAEEIVTSRLNRFSSRLTRVEIHVADVNGPRGGSDDIVCTLEARPEGGKPVTVKGNGGQVDAALRDAADKMQALLDTHFGKLRTH
ncbi:HPF/RaiA family ribosome-associated protein [Blastomonas sp. AAP53]|uniref:HPF/RaiA family ribosome-associated protein n=1 Tax=Blastomonas sp. AAP53 TaxID=1248760 RepID=UPI00047758B5|nr:HPF/RaiA family ribosome-associated protein [Blastomonas sp. AAP53]